MQARFRCSYKTTTTNGVILELGRVPLCLFAQRVDVKNWERIKNGRANHLLSLSFKDTQTYSLDWINKINKCLSEIGMYHLFLNSNVPNELPTHNEVFKRLLDICHQNQISSISCETCKLRTYSLIKSNIGYENYLSNVRNVKSRETFTKFRLSNHDLMIEVGRYKKIP